VSRLNPPSELEQQQRAALRIQSAVRRYTVKKKYKITPLVEKLEGPLQYIGNDPDVFIPDALKSDKPFVLVGTSCLRVLDIAAMFCAKETVFVPKVIVVDANPAVREFWLCIKQIVENFSDIGDLVCFFTNMFGRTRMNECRVICQFLVAISNEFGFDRLKKMIGNVVPLTHDWTDPQVIFKIKNICDRIGLDIVYTYTSNILACIDSFDDFDSNPKVDQLLRNIETLKPRASVFSDCDLSLRCSPSKMLCYSGAGNRAQLVLDIGMRSAKKRYIAEARGLFFEKFKEQDFRGAYAIAVAAFIDCSALTEVQETAARFKKIRFTQPKYNKTNDVPHFSPIKN